MTETKKKILLVDDERAILKVLGIKLRVCGYDVVTATNGKEALELIQSSKPDIMLLDIIMPVMDGFDVLQKLRSFSQLPVIAFSARLENVQRALKLGANLFLPKPFDVEDLVKGIRTLLDKG